MQIFICTNKEIWIAKGQFIFKNILRNKRRMKKSKIHGKYL